MSNNKIINAIGIVAVLVVIIAIYNFIKNRTETKLYSDKAFDKLQNKENISELNSVVANYHKNGEWKKIELK